MKRLLIIVSLFITLVMVFPLAAQNRGLNLQPGEMFVFKIRVFGYEVGTQVMHLLREDWVRGQRCWKATAITQSTPQLRELARIVTGKPYELRDVFMTYMRQDNFNPVRVLKGINEGGWIDNVRIEFFTQEKQGVYYNKVIQSGERFSWNGEILDVLSIIYYIRNKDLTPGSVYSFNYLDERTFESQSSVVQVDNYTITRNGQQHEVLRVHQIEGDSDLNIEVFLTKDPSHKPIRITLGAFQVANYGVIDVVGDLVWFRENGSTPIPCRIQRLIGMPANCN
jgi:hypothetical protein